MYVKRHSSSNYIIYNAHELTAYRLTLMTGFVILCKKMGNECCTMISLFTYYVWTEFEYKQDILFLTVWQFKSPPYAFMLQFKYDKKIHRLIDNVVVLVSVSFSDTAILSVTKYSLKQTRVMFGQCAKLVILI